MHGVVMAGMREFVVENMGRGAWAEAKQVAGVDRNRYSFLEDYPDEEFLGIYAVLLEETDATNRQLQQQFGQFLFEELSELYGSIYFDDDWGVLELFENIEGVIHQSLKQRDIGTFTPPELGTETVGDDHIAILYSSERHLCEFGKGLIQGAADHYGSTVTIDEPNCMKDGDDRCRIEVQRIA